MTNSNREFNNSVTLYYSYYILIYYKNIYKKEKDLQIIRTVFNKKITFLEDNQCNL